VPWIQLAENIQRADLSPIEEATWKPEDVVIRQPEVLDTVDDVLRCEGCRAKLTGDEAIPGLCAACSDTIDADTEARLEREHFGDLW
jgi:hypothetical protein